MTTVTIWIPKKDLENFRKIEGYLTADIEFDEIIVNNKFPITIYTEKMHIETLQLNVNLDLFVKLNLK